MSGSLPWTAAGAATRTGPRHDRNEDQYRVLDRTHPVVARMRRGALYAVCDGVSTTPRGREAAVLGAARLGGFFDEVVPPRLESLVQLVGEIDWELREVRKGDAATTLAALWLADGVASVVLVGDSQVLRVRHGHIESVTAQKRRGGLSSFLGMGPRVADVVEVWQDRYLPGDLYVLLTDGVTEVMRAEEVLDAWWDAGGACALAAERIVAEVDRRGGSDDATVLFVDVLGEEVDNAGVGL